MKTQGPDGYLKCIPSVVRLERGQHVAVKIGAAHKSTPFYPAIHSRDLDRIDNQNCEIFAVSHVGMVGDQLYYWGMFVEGLGAFNMMVPGEHVRRLLPHEREAWSKKRMGIYGSHTGNLSYTTGSGVQAEA